MIYFKRTNAADPDYLSLVTLLDTELAIRDGEEHAFYAQYNGSQDIRNVVVGYNEALPVACGAFKYYEDSVVEIKRMFVSDGYRGHGVGMLLLAELETWAQENGIKACILETGKKQPEAIRLYTKAGYKLIDNYGQYQNIENSVCMKKEL